MVICADNLKDYVYCMSANLIHLFIYILHPRRNKIQYVYLSISPNHLRTWLESRDILVGQNGSVSWHMSSNMPKHGNIHQCILKLRNSKENHLPMFCVGICLPIELTHWVNSLCFRQPWHFDPWQRCLVAKVSWWHCWHSLEAKVLIYLQNGNLNGNYWWTQCSDQNLTFKMGAYSNISRLIMISPNPTWP